MIKGIIFDFDGVICESVGVKTDGFAMLYEPYGKDVVNKVIKHHLINGGVSRFEKLRFYHKNFLGIDISNKELNNLVIKFSEFVVEKVIEAPFVKGAYEFLLESQHAYQMYISTATPQSEIEFITKQKKIDGFFKGIYGSPENKMMHIKKIINSNYLHKEETVFIGDSIQDKSAADRTGLIFIARTTANESILMQEKYKMKDISYLKTLLTDLEH